MSAPAVNQGEYVTYASLCGAVANALKAAKGTGVVQNFDEISEGIHDTPMTQVYPEAGETDVESDNAAYATFGGQIKRTLYTLQIDGYAKERSELGRDLAAQMQLIDAIDAVLYYQKPPFYGVMAIKQHRWTWQRVTLARAGDQLQYAGVRFVLELYIF